MKRRISLIPLALILALGAVLRLVDLAGPSLWLDEILHLRVTRVLADDPWYAHAFGVREVGGTSENGPLYYRLQIWGQRMAPGDLGVRLLPATIGVSTLLLMALTGWRIGGPLLAVVATLLLALSPLHVVFSREGRPYYLLMTLTLWLLAALVLRGSRWGIALAVTGCLLTAYVGIQGLPVLASYTLLATGAALWDLRQSRETPGTPRGARRLAPLIAPTAALAALALAFGLYMTRTDVNSPLREKAPVQVKVEQSPLYSSPLSQHSLGLLLASMTTSGHPSRPLEPRTWLLLAVALVGLISGLFRRSPGAVFSAGMFLLPTLLSLAALVSVSRWYGIRYTSAGLPAFLLLTAIGLVGIAELAGQRLASRPSRRQAATWATAAALVLALVAPNLGAARQDPYRKLDWRGVASFFDAVALPDEPVVVPNGWPEICLTYYLQELDRTADFVTIWESAALGEEAVAEHPKGWLLTAGFRRTNEVRAWMHRFVSVLKKPEEELDLFFFPDFRTLLETRFEAGKGAVFEQHFADMGLRFEFEQEEALLKGRGWSYPERNELASFQWAVGPRAELGLPIGPPRDATLRLRVLPFSYPQAPTQQLELWLNDARLVTLELPTQWSEHEVAVPAAAWSSGANLLSLRFARTISPAEVIPNAGDGRSLSAAFDYLEVLF